MTPNRWRQALRAVSEKEWQAQVIEILRWHRWDVYHTHDSRHSAAGFPDLVAAKPGDLFVAELKREGENPTPAQYHWLGLFELAGVDWYVWKPSDIDRVVERARREQS